MPGELTAGETSAERRRDHAAVRLWIQLEHRSVEVPIRAVLEWSDPVRAEISDYVLHLAAIEVRNLELRAATTVPAAIRPYLPLSGRS